LRGFSIEKAEIFRQALDGRRFWMNIENTDLSRILFKIIAKQHLLKLTTKRERQRMAIRWKKNLGVDVSKMTGLFDI
ncbi:MAG: hypothetical protein KGI25_03470, partial [Thaumarchaeota archaeon]|nr:hypothetical protein [Nitrososphaerota archaeon]